MLTKAALRLLFVVCLSWFLYRGPYRAVRYSTTGDFSTVYAAARCWLHGTNPYSRVALKAELAAAGAPADIQRDQDVNPSVYLPSALPWMIPFAALSWTGANVAWCELSVLLFALSLAALLRFSRVDERGWWVAASLGLLFSPTYVGIYDGNPGVVIISLIILSICATLRSSAIAGALLFGLALCFKPQLACCAVLLFLLWRKWRVLTAGTVLFAVSLLVGWLVVSHGGRSAEWRASEQRNIETSYRPGGTSDPTPASPVGWQLLNAQTIASYATPDPLCYNLAVWCAGLALATLFWRHWHRGQTLSPWQEAAFCAALTLVISYHRYYDAQLLLLLIPFICELWRTRKAAVRFAIAGCLLPLAFPLQSYFVRLVGEDRASVASLEQFALLRNQPVATLVLAALLASPLVKRRAETRR